MANLEGVPWIPPCEGLPSICTNILHTLRPHALELHRSYTSITHRMVICYQFESACFPTPYTDNQLLCSHCGPKRSHSCTSLRAWNTTTRFSSRSFIQLLQFHSKITPEKISEIQKSKIFLWNMSSDHPRRCTTCALIAHVTGLSTLTHCAWDTRISAITHAHTHCIIFIMYGAYMVRAR